MGGVRTHVTCYVKLFGMSPVLCDDRVKMLQVTCYMLRFIVCVDRAKMLHITLWNVGGVRTDVTFAKKDDEHSMHISSRNGPEPKFLDTWRKEFDQIP